MADTKITALTAITTVDPANDVLPIVDVSDTSMAASGTTKKITTNQLLGASGTATLASASITGDLTVDTSTLKVDSANNRVIVGHTSGSSAFQVTNAGAAGIEIQPTGFSSAPLILSYNRSAPAYTQLTLDGSTIVHALSGSTAMTLNSTGLGVGKAPLARLDVASTRAASVIGGIVGTTGTGVVNDECQFLIKNVNTASGQNNGAGIGGLLEASASNKSSLLFYVDNGTAVTNVGRFDSNGNFGIGVTPSAWGGSYKALQLQSVARNIAATGAGSGDFTVAFNAIYDSTDSRWEYAGTGDKAGRYSQTGSGNHRWFVSNTAGTAGNEITDFASAAMTLDASGRLLVGPTSANTSGGVLQLSSGITFPATQVASSDANTLDDYEEGTFTPTVVGATSAGTGTYSAQNGRYTKVGRLVTVEVDVAWSAHTGTGNMLLGGLPFTTNSTVYSSVAFGYVHNIALTAGNILTGYTGLASSTINLYQTPTGGGGAAPVPIDTAGQILYSVTYSV